MADVITPRVMRTPGAMVGAVRTYALDGKVYLCARLTTPCGVDISITEPVLRLMLDVLAVRKADAEGEPDAE